MTSLCDLCGIRGGVLTYGVVFWSEARPGQRWGSATRCVDREACRARLVSEGKPWPVIDDPRERAAIAREWAQPVQTIDHLEAIVAIPVGDLALEPLDNFLPVEKLTATQLIDDGPEWAQPDWSLLEEGS